VDPFAKVRHKRRDTSDSIEIARICSLPIVEIPDEQTVEAFSHQVVQADHYESGFRLHPEQVGAVLAYDLYEGLFAPIGVGRGKTLITLLIADRAFQAGIERSLLVVPPGVVSQLTMTDIPQARKTVGIRVPFIHMSGRPSKSRSLAANSGKRGCYVMPYSYLSIKDAEQLLMDIKPELIILDEAHNVKNRSAARTRRLLRVMNKLLKRPKIVALSGTITSKSIMDYHHLIAPALNDNCPLPRSDALATNWSYVLDATANPSEGQTGPIAPLLEWARREFPDEDIPRGIPGFRQSYKLRLNHCPGVVSSGDAEIGTSLVIENHPVKQPEKVEGFSKLQQLMRDVEELFRSPSGDEIEFPMHKWRHLYELTSGFYYHLRWPSEAELIEKRRLSVDEATAYLERAKEHHAAHQIYNVELRRWLDRRGKPGLDTPMLVAGDMSRNGSKNTGTDLYDLWTAMKALEFEGMPERISEPIRVCPWKIEHVARWAGSEKGGALLWFWHQEVGVWLTETLQKMGLDPIWCPADSVRPGSSERVLDKANAGRVLVASMGGHGTGKNLQHFQRQALVEFPRKADLLEQVLGRTHRYGQEADELTPVTVNSCEFDNYNMSACLIDSLYIHQTTGTRQKAIYASYNPLPVIYPTDFLRERGFVDLPQLDAKARAALEERFGEEVARYSPGGSGCPSHFKPNTKETDSNGRVLWYERCEAWLRFESTRRRRIHCQDRPMRPLRSPTNRREVQGQSNGARHDQWRSSRGGASQRHLLEESRDADLAWQHQGLHRWCDGR